MDNMKVIEKLSEKKLAVTGVPTGFTELDKMTSGFQPSDLIIVAGRPSMGKTAFCLNIAQHVGLSEGGLPVGVFSLEMSKEQLVMRLLSSEAEVEFPKLRSGAIKDTEWHQIGTAAGRLYTAPIYIDDTPALSILELRARARRLKRSTAWGCL